MIKSQRGNALLLALSLAAFVGVIAMEMYRRVETTALRSQRAQFKEEARLIMQTFETQIQNPETCTRMLYDQVIAPGIDPGATVILNYVYDPTAVPGATTLTANSLVTLGMRLNGVEIFAPGIPDRYDEIVDPASGASLPMRRYRASLRAAFEVDGGSKLGLVNFRKDSVLGTDFGIPFYAWTDPDGRIKSCFGRNSAGAVCNLARGYYHVEPPANPQFGHEISCRQTGFMTEEIDGAGNPVAQKGTCRFVGFAKTPAGCGPLASSFVPGITNQYLIHDGTGISSPGFMFFPFYFGYTQTVICTQCR